MGMDVFGQNPSGEKGGYFRNNVWWWRPLADYCWKIAPDIAANCQNWGTNDGDGLDAEDSIKLADALQAEIDSGRCAAFAAIYEAEQNNTPNDPCDLCEGTGTRKPVPDRGAGDPNKDGIKCNACNGTGSVRPWSTQYPFSVENVQEFVEFLRECGGFSIC